MPARHQAFGELTGLFAQYGVESFLKSTNLLVVLLDRDGELLSWNPSFGMIHQALPDRKLLKDFLSPSSMALFDELLSSTLREHVRTRGKLRFADENRRGDFAALTIPLPDDRILFIAEPVRATTELKAVTAELQKTKRSLAIKETELKAVIAQADEVANTDALTFLPNRRQMIGDLQREVILSDRYDTPLAISMLDIAHFKNINDTYGHPVGDEVLQRLAGELRQRIRQPDTIGRYGGEEFLVILPHSTLQAAIEQAERLCRHVRSLLIKSKGPEISLTISIGIAQYKTHKEDWQTFLSRADAALYQAKNNGRDRWAVSEE
ncbi:MAG TPA: GGDEF domain-containing protein [Anaerolineales bacterium]|nr:GGDEF domain-containing protein [Anaerolineales bacterium]